MFASGNKPYTAITVQINQLTGSNRDADDMSGIPDLIEVIRIQSSGPSEAARAIRKKFKYGNTDQQLRALTILDTLMENAGQQFQRRFADEALLERLRVLSTDSVVDEAVKKQCSHLFRRWAVIYKATPGMAGIVALEKQLPRRKKPMSQQQSKVLQDTQPNPEENPFDSDPDESTSVSPQQTGPSNLASRPDYAPPREPAGKADSSHGGHAASRLHAFMGGHKKARSDKSSSKTVRRRGFNLEREKPQMVQTIASASLASTNLMNALRLIDREHKRVSEDAHASTQFENCKKLRRQILRYIQHLESEEWLGGLIHANDCLIEALMAFEILDKSVDDDSDSDAMTDMANTDAPPPMPRRPRTESVHQQMTTLGLSNLEQDASGAKSLQRRHEDTGGGGDKDAADNDPFADINAV